MLNFTELNNSSTISCAKLNWKSERAIMKIKSLMKRLAAVLAVAGGLTLAGLAQAQDIYYWYNFYPPWQPHSSLYPNWNSYLTNTAAVNFNTVFALRTRC